MALPLFRIRAAALMSNIGRITKDSTDVSRVRVDFSTWLDETEVINSIQSILVSTGLPSWVEDPAFPAATDTTPLTILSSTLINTATGVEIYLRDGTPGSDYTVAFVIWASSLRQDTIRFGVHILGQPPVAAGTTPLLSNGAISRLGDTMLGRLYLVGDPLNGTEAATKNYVDDVRILLETERNAELDAEIAARIAGDAAEATTRNAAIITEVNDRTTADNSLQAQITSETGTRIAAISAEAAARALSDANEATDRTTADNSLQGQITAEAATRAAAIAAMGFVGEIRASAGTIAITGWGKCDGGAYSRTVYAALFAAIGTNWGPGDGSTTFNVPDFRGRALFGLDNMGSGPANRITPGVSGITSGFGVTGGDERLHGHGHSVTQSPHTHTTTQTPHAHGLPVVLDGGTGSLAGGRTGGAATDQTSRDASITIDVVANSVSIAIDVTGTGASQNMPPAALVLWLIRLV